MIKAALVASALALALAAPVCTEKQKDLYYTDERDFCALETMDFQVCDDRCLASLEKLKLAAADCVFSEHFEWTLASRAAEHVASCVSLRANSSAAGTYVPRSTAGLPVCTDEMLEPWENAYGFRSTAYDACQRAMDEGTAACSSDCLSAFRNSVFKAPVCEKETGHGYWHGEREKKYLQRCLVSRGESVASDEAMKAHPVVDGKLTTTTTTPSASETTTATTNATTTSAPTTVSSAPCGDFVTLTSALVIGSALAVVVL